MRQIDLPDVALRISRSIAAAGGKPVVVGGYVRDQLLGIASKDVDIEVFGLDLEQLEVVLRQFGEVLTIGRAFGVLRVKGVDIDISMPRTDNKVGTGHRGFEVRCDPGLSFAQAARRRDLTINSIGYDPIAEGLLDPFDGAKDIKSGVLRATDPEHFSEDPLRGLRVAQFAARFEFTVAPALLQLCGGLDLADLPAERIFGELKKLLLKGKRPSVGLEMLHQCGLVRFFPALAATIDVPQEPKWHPEGDVWQHTMMVVDQAARLRDGGQDDLALMLGALCHDLGKAETTVARNGYIATPAHDIAGARLTETWLQSLRAPNDLTTTVATLVRHHLAPALYVKNGATAKAYRRLARQLHQAGASLQLLYRVARADHLGRTTEEALAGRFPNGERFMALAEEHLVLDRVPHDVVLGRHLIARGLKPGKHFGTLLRRCREIQDETGWDNPHLILEAAFAAEPTAGCAESDDT